MKHLHTTAKLRHVIDNMLAELNTLSRSGSYPGSLFLDSVRRLRAKLRGCDTQLGQQYHDNQRSHYIDKALQLTQSTSPIYLIHLNAPNLHHYPTQQAQYVIPPGNAVNHPSVFSPTISLTLHLFCVAIFCFFSVGAVTYVLLSMAFCNESSFHPNT
jgi:hypothetical protein